MIGFGGIGVNMIPFSQFEYGIFFIFFLFAQFRVCTVLPLRHFGVYIKREIHQNRGIDFSEKQ